MLGSVKKLRELVALCARVSLAHRHFVPGKKKPSPLTRTFCLVMEYRTQVIVIYYVKAA